MRVSYLSNLVPFSGPPRWRGERREGRPRLGQPNHRMQGQAHLRAATATGTRSVFPKIQISFGFFFQNKYRQKICQTALWFLLIHWTKKPSNAVNCLVRAVQENGEQDEILNKVVFSGIIISRFGGKRQLGKAWIIFHPVMLPFPRRTLRTEGIFPNFSNIPISQSLLRKKIYKTDLFKHKGIPFESRGF